MVFNIVKLMNDFGETNPAYNELKLVVKIVQQFEHSSSFLTNWFLVRTVLTDALTQL